MPPTPVLVTKPEAARRAGIGLRQIRRAVNAGEIPEFLVGGWPRIRWADVEVWIARSQRKAVERPNEVGKVPAANSLATRTEGESQ